ncbi:AN1-type zinc finger protein 2A [Crotalus adamanteus]|uniref:AN1-type zinc finger protein 2A n=1 Tax=Crotalus adamanteus TaxID=8729 RepID=A0AAW1AT68_CROAD
MNRRNCAELHKASERLAGCVFVLVYTGLCVFIADPAGSLSCPPFGENRHGSAFPQLAKPSASVWLNSGKWASEEMEFPDLGQHCCEKTCRRLDFLPLKCDACKELFCKDHIVYRRHKCSSVYKKDVQVPVCPLCNTLVPVRKGEMPDVAVGAPIWIGTVKRIQPSRSRKSSPTNASKEAAERKR